jgi:hypothetical protein
MGTPKVAGNGDIAFRLNLLGASRASRFSRSSSRTLPRRKSITACPDREATGKEWSEYPSIMLDGKRRSLFNAAAIISKELGYQRDLLARHQEKVDPRLSKQQRCYGRTAYNLVSRAYENASASIHRRAALRSRQSSIAA